MGLSVLKAAADAEKVDGLHLACLVVLLRSADKRGKAGPKPVEGITKLAKLDFLLRYPVYLERALMALNKSSASRRAPAGAHDRRDQDDPVPLRPLGRSLPAMAQPPVLSRSHHPVAKRA